MPVPVVSRDPLWGFRFYADPPEFSLNNMPEDAALVIPSDGGIWVVDRLTGIRYRRVTTDDLPKHVTFNTRGPGKNSNRDEDDE